MTTPPLVQAAMDRRLSLGLTVEATVNGQTFTRHCTDAADRDAYLARCKARGEPTRIISQTTPA